ncbi:RNA-dependent RNA polymerase [Erysiphe necator associated ourmia-like virus 55]|nr:RNA-dependent RNA polymerase [Erysiphe necator associated ourmia-like virus 55]
MTDKRSRTKSQFSSVLYLPKGTPRPCRDFMARTTLVVQRASSSVRRLHSVSLPVFTPCRVRTCSDLLKQVKEYLASDLEIQEECRMAFQSIKKLLPESCKCLKHSMLADLCSRLSRPPPSLPPGYIQFVREISSEIFTNGWDYAWSSKVQSFSPSLGSCIGTSRKNGGQLATLATSGQLAWQESLVKPQPGSLEGELLLVNSSGKPRALTRFGAEAASLRPLHGLLYDTLSKQSWLLRGDVSAEKLGKAGFDYDKSSEEPLTSGDYKSASDNLSIEVAEAILDVAWTRSKHVPAPVFRYAVAAQRPNLSYEGEDGLKEHFVPTRGQMMGSYLCFPLLCLQNYIAFRYAERQCGMSDIPVLINGDDILFQSTATFSEFWMSVVGGLGLEVEKTKTSVSKEFGTLNSTLVRWVDGRLAVVKTLRLGMLRECGHPGSLGDTALLFSRVGPRDSWLKNSLEFIRWHEHTILKWNCVLSDMGFRGRLMRRAFTKYRCGRLLWRDDVLHQMKLDRLPAAHCPHNIVMGSQEFVTVSRDLVDKKMSREASIWMASRKWELGKEYEGVKPTKAVTERAKATQLPPMLTSRKYPTKGLKEESARVLKRREYWWTDIANFIGSLKAPKGYERSASAWREVKLERVWWGDRCHADEIRVPKSIWEASNPAQHHEGLCLLTKPSSVPYVDTVASLRDSTTQEGEEFFYSGIGHEMSGLPVYSFFRQFWAMI